MSLAYIHMLLRYQNKMQINCQIPFNSLQYSQLQGNFGLILQWEKTGKSKELQLGSTLGRTHISDFVVQQPMHS